VIKIKLDLSNYFFIAFFILISYISFLILNPFMISILSSFIIAFIFYPLYKKVRSKIRNETISALVISLLIILIIIMPTIFLINTLTKEVSNIYSSTTITLTQSEDLIPVDCTSETSLCKIIDSINHNQKIRFYISGAVTNFASVVTRGTSEFLFSIPKRIIEVLIIFLLVFYLMKSGDFIWKKTKDLLPLKEAHKAPLLKKFSGTIKGVLYGYIIIAILEGITGWATFYLIGSDIALILGIIIAILALIPMVGASIILIPASLLYFFEGSTIKAVIILISAFIIMVLDLWGRAKIIGDRTDIHPAVVALGVLGGLVTFGAVGIIIGPLILSLLITSIEIYQREKDSFVFDCIKK
jgi:predicted PurR-regulated permease PerM